MIASALHRLRQSPDEESWGISVRLYTPLLYAWASRAGMDEADAADLVQDVFHRGGVAPGRIPISTQRQLPGLAADHSAEPLARALA
jgi:RNA polymerase sigma-70 factor (ECF subfamily)